MSEPRHLSSRRQSSSGTNGSGSSSNSSITDVRVERIKKKMNNHFTGACLLAISISVYIHAIMRWTHSMNLSFSGVKAKRVLRFLCRNFYIYIYINVFLFNVSRRAWNRVNISCCCWFICVCFQIDFAFVWTTVLSLFYI